MMAPQNEFVKIREIGRGSFGEVWLAKNLQTGERVAIKYLRRGENINENTLRELLNQRNLLHHHVIQFKRAFLTKTHLAIVMQYGEGISLADFVAEKGALTEEKARWMFQQLIVAIDYCHKMGICNRDIKLENVVLDKDCNWPLARMCDFGLSKNIKDSEAKTNVGTLAYMAPEVISACPPNTYDGKKADVWSAGVALYYMACGLNPFEDDACAINADARYCRILCNILESDVDFPPERNISEDLKELLLRMLEKNPRQRFTIEDVMNNHWFRTNLPPGALDMNNSMSSQHHGLQSKKEIIYIWMKAKEGQRYEGKLEKQFCRHHRRHTAEP